MTVAVAIFHRLAGYFGLFRPFAIRLADAFRDARPDFPDGTALHGIGVWRHWHSMFRGRDGNCDDGK
jgi:hypothetical protein